MRSVTYPYLDVIFSTTADGQLPLFYDFSLPVGVNPLQPVQPESLAFRWLM